MKICNLTKYKAGNGDILVLEDMHTEGIHIMSQHHRVNDAVDAIRHTYSPNVAIVRVMEIAVTEIQTELPLGEVHAPRRPLGTLCSNLIDIVSERENGPSAEPASDSGSSGASGSDQQLDRSSEVGRRDEHEHDHCCPDHHE